MPVLRMPLSLSQKKRHDPAPRVFEKNPERHAEPWRKVEIDGMEVGDQKA